MPFIPWLVFLAAATLEVAGDAVIRQGLRGKKLALVLGGCAVLASYGLLVNSLCNRESAATLIRRTPAKPNT